MDISFKFDPELLIGADTLSMAGTIAGRYGSRIMVAADHGVDSQVVSRLKGILEDSGVEAIVFDGIEDDSSVDMSGNIVELSCAGHCDAIIGLGGQKTQIIARMAAIMAPMKISVFELFDGRLFPDKLLPFISIPTEGMSAFSLTEYFVATDPRSRLIRTIQSPSNLFAAVIIDSSLFKFIADGAAPAFVFDGFFSALEAYCSSKANFLSDALLERALSFYAKLIKGGSNIIDADVFAQAEFLSALGCSSSSPGVGAALALAINARFPVPVPHCSAALLPVIAEQLITARPEKMARAAAFLGGAKAASVADAAKAAVDSIRRSMGNFQLQTDLKSFSISLDRLTAAAEAARGLEFTANSPWIVSEEALFDILKKVI